MSKDQCSGVLWGWEGYRVNRVSHVRRGASGWVEVYLCPCRPVGTCSGCLQEVDQVHDVTERWVRDLPILDAKTRVRVPRRRLACPRCGPKLEDLAWLARYARLTTRLAEQVARLCQVLPIKQVAEYYDLDWDTVRSIDEAYLERTLGPVDLAGLETFIMDEFAIQKGHRYATVIVDPQKKKVLWVCRGHTREAIRPFFELLGPEGCRKIQAVGMDMNGAYEIEVRQHCPNAKIIYDLFHVLAKYAREVINRVRLDEMRRHAQNEPMKHVFKGSRWLLLSNKENLKHPRDQIRLSELLRLNRALMIVYVLKDDLKELWRLRDPEAVRAAWKSWHRRAMHSRVKPLKKFARKLTPYLEGIVAHSQWPLHTSLLEGINNRIKVIKRMAYGYRDDRYFFLKIRAAFPGIS